MPHALNGLHHLCVLHLLFIIAPVLVFCFALAMWMLPAVVGEAPPPCDGFTLTTISTNTAVVYGGGTAKCMERLSDLYLLEMELKQMVNLGNVN